MSNNIMNIQPSGQISRVNQEMTLVAVYPAGTQFVNLTPHVLSVHTNAEGSIELYSVEYGEVTGLPPEKWKKGVVYITSGMVNAALPHRSDVVSPGELVRDENGKPIGCKGLRK